MVLAWVWQPFNAGTVAIRIPSSSRSINTVNSFFGFIFTSYDCLNPTIYSRKSQVPYREYIFIVMAGGAEVFKNYNTGLEAVESGSLFYRQAGSLGGKSYRGQTLKCEKPGETPDSNAGLDLGKPRSSSPASSPKKQPCFNNSSPLDGNEAEKNIVVPDTIINVLVEEGMSKDEYRAYKKWAVEFLEKHNMLDIAAVLKNENIIVINAPPELEDTLEISVRVAGKNCAQIKEVLINGQNYNVILLYNAGRENNKSILRSLILGLESIRLRGKLESHEIKEKVAELASIIGQPAAKPPWLRRNPFLDLSKEEFLKEYHSKDYVRPGYFGKDKNAIHEKLNQWFGAGNWEIRHLIDGTFVSLKEALVYYEDAYFEYFKSHPEELEWLVRNGSDVYDNNLTNIHSGTNYEIQETPDYHFQDIAIRRVFKRLWLVFKGAKYVQVRGLYPSGRLPENHISGAHLSPARIFFHQPELILQPQLEGFWKPNSIEAFYQSSKVIILKNTCNKKAGLPSSFTSLGKSSGSSPLRSQGNFSGGRVKIISDYEESLDKNKQFIIATADTSARAAGFALRNIDSITGIICARGGFLSPLGNIALDRNLPMMILDSDDISRLKDLFIDVKEFIDTVHFKKGGYFARGEIPIGEYGDYLPFPLGLSPGFGRMLADMAVSLNRGLRKKGLLQRNEKFIILENGVNTSLSFDILSYIRNFHPKAYSQMVYRIVDFNEDAVRAQKECNKKFENEGKFEVVFGDVRQLDKTIPHESIKGFAFSNELLETSGAQKVNMYADKAVTITFLMPKIKTPEGREIYFTKDEFMRKFTGNAGAVNDFEFAEIEVEVRKDEYPEITAYLENHKNEIYSFMKEFKGKHPSYDKISAYINPDGARYIASMAGILAPGSQLMVIEEAAGTTDLFNPYSFANSLCLAPPKQA
ncbi:MAG TPA: hypothetical protein DCL49_01740, partial [Candidatus Omnitrophica bacterium]|nr:hypothetical protein [Candidatus Omnitrophota bacterium]